MNGKRMLDSMNGVDVAFVEEAAYPKRKKKAFHRTGMTVAAACLAMFLSVGAIAYASGSIDALRYYFMPQNETIEALLHEGTLTTTDGKMEMRVDNYIADKDEFIFTVSLTGTGEKIAVGDALETTWVTNAGEKITDYDKEFGAYTVGKGWGEEFAAHADSMYEDADATFIVINTVPNGYRIEELKAVEVSCKGLTLDVEVGDSVVDTYTLSAKNGEEYITDLTVSAIGFSFTSADSDIGEICMIKTDGTYAKGDGESDKDGFYGYWASISSIDDSEMYSVRGRWGGEGAISTGILDLSQYTGIKINNTNYYFDE